MPVGVVELREVPDGNRNVEKPFIAGTLYEITSDILRTSSWGALSFSEIDKDLDIEYEVTTNKVSDVRRYAAVPAGVRRILDSHGCYHSGLALDRFIYRSAGQSFVKHALQKVVEVNNASGADTQWFRDLRNRWMAVTHQGDNLPLRCTTIGPLTLHLARASALENAGICLHPLYGFAYLPGSGVKGMARAYAETVWLPAQPDQKQAWRQIEDVFGWAPNPDRRQQIHNSEHPAEVRRKDDADPESPEIKASSGNIVFHDTWPEAWPKLIVDIVNNHHPHYYTGQPTKLDRDGNCDDCKMHPSDANAHPPGDWENTVPVYFLAVAPGVTFTFPLAKRRADVADELLNLAHEWLLGALCHLGAGAKTNAGYGAFKPADGEPPALPSQKRAVFETTLELVTPAFLAGANQQAEDCDLRPATLRGLLRWWWRTMHAGFLDVQTLRALEAAIWGDTKGGGAVRLEVERLNAAKPSPVPGKRIQKDRQNRNRDVLRADPDFCRERGLERPPEKTSQGVLYLAFGTDEMPTARPAERKQRFVIEPSATWRVRLVSRATHANRKDVGDPTKAKHGKDITAEQALGQAKAALWLLCYFGAVGSKARKGFGSLTAERPQNHSLEACRDAAKQLRQQLGLSNDFDERRAHSPSVEQMLDPVEVAFSWPNVWSVLDQIGFAYQSFAKKYKHMREKLALGLPRRIGSPVQGTFNPTPPVTANSRHSSPVHIHVEGKPGNWTVRVIAFPAAHLPDLPTSQAFLNEFLKDFGDDLRRRASLSPPSGPPGGAGLARPPAAQTGPAVAPAPVRVKFLGPHESLKTPQQAFWVQELGKKRGLLKYGQIPTPLPAVDSEIEVYRTNDNPQSPEYRWDKPAPPRDQPRGGRGSRGGRR